MQMVSINSVSPSEASTSSAQTMAGEHLAISVHESTLLGPHRALANFQRILDPANAAHKPVNKIIEP